MSTQATTVPATHLDVAPTSGHDFAHLLGQLRAAEERHCALVLLRPQGKEYDDFTEVDWEIEKEVRDLNMEMHRLGAHIHELEMELLWAAEQEAGGGGSVGWGSGEEREMVASDDEEDDAEEGGVPLGAVGEWVCRVFGYAYLEWFRTCIDWRVDARFWSFW